jgi:hypothetical protein
MLVQYDRTCCSSGPARVFARRDMTIMSLRAAALPDCMHWVMGEVQLLHHMSTLASAAMSAKMHCRLPRLQRTVCQVLRAARSAGELAPACNVERSQAMSVGRVYHSPRCRQLITRSLGAVKCSRLGRTMFGGGWQTCRGDARGREYVGSRRRGEGGGAVEQRVDGIVGTCQCRAVERGAPVARPGCPDVGTSVEEEVDKGQAQAGAGNLTARVGGRWR